MGSELFHRMNTEEFSPDPATGEKHLPKITIEGKVEKGQPFKVNVDVGGGKHPNQNEHHIQWIELRMNGLFVARTDLIPVVMNPVVTFTVAECPADKCEITAIERCNLHGLWEGKLDCECGCGC